MPVKTERKVPNISGELMRRRGKINAEGGRRRWGFHVIYLD